MANPTRLQLTIGQVMGLVAGVAVVCALLVSAPFGRVMRVIGFVALPMAALVAIGLVVLQHLANPALGVGCPYCGRATLERRSVRSFGHRFYRCSHCGVRCMRVILGGWKDASGPEHDPRYQAKAEADPWSAAPGLEDEDLIASKTHHNLIQNKRNRQPQNPNGPGLE